MTVERPQVGPNAGSGKGGVGAPLALVEPPGQPLHVNGIERLSDASGRTFTPRVGKWLAGIAGVSLLATLLLSVLLGSEAPTKVTADNNAFSVSAVGHAALAELYDEVGIEVLVSRHRSAERASSKRALFLLEPGIGDKELERFEGMLGRALEAKIPTVVALPKWRVTEQVEGLGWANRLERSTEWRTDELARAMDNALGTTLVEDLEVYDAGEPWTAELKGTSYTIALEPSQLIYLPLPAAGEDGGYGGFIEPVITDDDEGVLLGRLRGTNIYLLSDPDLLSTMGLGLGDHALVTVALVERVLGVDGVVIDEVTHGYEKARTIWRELFDFPLVLVTFHLAGLLALALWASTSRFGKPESPPPRVPTGKKTLIENTATLLALGHHAGTGVKRYLETALRQLSRAYGLPAELPETKRLELLAQLARRVDPRHDLEAIATEVAALKDGRGRHKERRARELASSIHRLKMEMLHGHRSGS